MHFRLSREMVQTLIKKFENTYIFKSLQEFAGYVPISAETHILSFLWFLGHESGGYRDIADRFGVTISTLHTIITRVTKFLVKIAKTIIQMPTREEEIKIKEYFLKEQGFPGVIGLIDGTHIRIDKPKEDPDSYINRKHFYSIHVQGVVDNNLKFIDVLVGYPGSVHDARVLNESPLAERMEENWTNGVYLLGDNAYPCRKELLVPYKDNGHLTHAQKNYNKKLSSCRIKIEHAFGLVKQRFRQLYHLKLRNLSRMVQVIYSAFLLHNIANASDMELFEPPLHDEFPDPDFRQVHFENEIFSDHENGKRLRDELCRQLVGS
ncbi:putative nuclease HARBI1 [Prorops nasuta]|uniref:putative nuclease HARBI1 n=1 Tax=Prorops nasuta TaxID=863751 RepID=UPI0034CFB1B8